MGNSFCRSRRSSDKPTEKLSTTTLPSLHPLMVTPEHDSEPPAPAQSQHDSEQRTKKLSTSTPPSLPPSAAAPEHDGEPPAPAGSRLDGDRHTEKPSTSTPPSRQHSAAAPEPDCEPLAPARSQHERTQQLLECLQEIGVDSYKGQKSRRSSETPDYSGNIPMFDPLSAALWVRLAEADARQKGSMSASPVPESLSRSSGSSALDKVQFKASFKERLAKSTEVKLALSETQLEQYTFAASEQQNIKSFDDFPFFDFSHPAMEEVCVPTRVSNLLQTFQAEIAKNSTQAGAISFASSRFRDVYKDKDTLRMKTPEDAWNLVKTFLHRLSGKPGFSMKSISGRHEFFEEVHAENFYQTLRAQFEADNIPLTSRAGASAEMNGWAAGETLVRCWTATNLCSPLQREFCSLLQQGVRMNDPDLATIVAQIWATMNVYCVANRKDSRDTVKRQIAWPGESVPRNPAEENRVLHRGARIHKTTLGWWNESCLSMEIFRVPGAVAVSKLSSKALHFMWNISKPDDQDMVYYRFHLNPLGTQPCDHAVCLDTVSVVPHEQEFLFPPFSSFQAVSKSWFTEQRDGEEYGYWVINIAVVKNNKEVSADVPLCPWL